MTGSEGVVGVAGAGGVVGVAGGDTGLADLGQNDMG